MDLSGPGIDVKLKERKKEEFTSTNFKMKWIIIKCVEDLCC
jgi:hypothetical protein